jgi:hypothetical protein
MKMVKQRGKQQFTGTAVFLYTSVCCDKPAKKDPCVRSKEDKKENKMSECALGTWRCGQCEKKTKVRRTKPQKEGVHDTQTVA